MKQHSHFHAVFDLKIHIYYTHFFLLFTEVVKSTAFWTQLLLFQKDWNFESLFCIKLHLKHNQIIGIWRKVCKKQWIWQNECKSFEFSHKKFIILACTLVWNLPLYGGQHGTKDVARSFFLMLLQKLSDYIVQNSLTWKWDDDKWSLRPCKTFYTSFYLMPQ